MKTLTKTFILIVFLFAEITLAQNAFEGKVVFEVQEDGNENVMNYYAKDK
ncbi:MAG: hypothetical protein HKP17_07120, partial [Ignavibacteriaceae bacterium]|nr:hypothetical protein [Ignavibacteriaceae bacterium]